VDSEERLTKEITRAASLALLSGMDPEECALCLLRLASELAVDTDVGGDDAAA